MSFGMLRCLRAHRGSIPVCACPVCLLVCTRLITLRGRLSVSSWHEKLKSVLGVTVCNHYSNHQFPSSLLIPPAQSSAIYAVIPIAIVFIILKICLIVWRLYVRQQVYVIYVYLFRSMYRGSQRWRWTGGNKQIAAIKKKKKLTLNAVIIIR